MVSASFISTYTDETLRYIQTTIPLVHMLGAEKGVNPMSSARMQRWYLKLSGYDYRLYYTPGKENVNADALSILPLPETLENAPQPTEIIHMMEKIDKSPINARAINQWTARDPVLSKVLDYTMQGWPIGKIKDEHLRPYAHRSMEISAQDGCLLWGTGVVVPSKGRAQILGELHTSHPGISRMKAFARSYVWWLNMDTGIDRLVRSCHQCQVNQHSPPEVPIHPWRYPDTAWEHLHVNYLGPFMNTMFLVVIDARTTWIELCPVSSASSETTVRKLLHIFSIHGLPLTIVSDNGTPFTGEEFQKFLTMNGIRHIT